MAQKRSKLQVFISHSSIDTWVARQISLHVKRCGASFFLDEADIQTGDDFEAKIIAAAEASSELLVLLTPWATTRPYIWLEMGSFWSRQKRIVGILHGLTPSKHLGRCEHSCYLEEVKPQDPERDRSVLLGIEGAGRGMGELTMNTNRHPAVFITHSRADAELAKRLAKALADEGALVQTDAAIVPGDTWPDLIEEVMERSDLILLLISAHSLASPSTNFEAGVALGVSSRTQLKLVPILLHGVTADALPQRLRSVQSIFATDPNEHAIVEQLRPILAATAGATGRAYMTEPL